MTVEGKGTASHPLVSDSGFSCNLTKIYLGPLYMRTVTWQAGMDFVICSYEKF